MQPNKNTHVLTTTPIFFSLSKAFYDHPLYKESPRLGIDPNYSIIHHLLIVPKPICHPKTNLTNKGITSRIFYNRNRVVSSKADLTHRE